MSNVQNIPFLLIVKSIEESKVSFHCLSYFCDPTCHMPHQLLEEFDLRRVIVRVKREWVWIEGRFHLVTRECATRLDEAHHNIQALHLCETHHTHSVFDTTHHKKIHADMIRSTQCVTHKTRTMHATHRCRYETLLLSRWYSASTINTTHRDIEISTHKVKGTIQHRAGWNVQYAQLSVLKCKEMT